MTSSKFSLKVLALRGSAWTVGGYGGSQLIRLARSLILTRLLYPEAFGLMSLVWMVMFALEMLSDAGLGLAIIRDKRGDDVDFLNTAWTLQAIRGAVLWVAAFLAAGPMAALYGEPQLAQLIPVAGLTALIAGFDATALHTCRRRLEFARLTVLELANEVLGLVVVGLWALLQPTVWALVGGALVVRSFAMFASHAFLPGIRHRFRWEPSSLRALFGFGKWIVPNSAIGLITLQGDRMLLGYYLDMAHLGTYSIAVMLHDAVHALVFKINHDVLFAAYGNVAQKEPDRVRSVYYRVRLAIDASLILPIGVLTVCASRLVAALYDARYHDAGWMFQLLCVRLLMTCAVSNAEVCLMALGHPQYAFFQKFLCAVWIIAGIPIGWSLMGMEGAIWAVALSELPAAAVLWIGLANHRILSIPSELRSLFFAGFGALLGFGLLRLLP